MSAMYAQSDRPLMADSRHQKYSLIAGYARPKAARGLLPVRSRAGHPDGCRAKPKVHADPNDQPSGPAQRGSSSARGSW